MKLGDVMKTLEGLGSAQTAKTYVRHGAQPPIFGVSYANMYKLQKKLAPNTRLARSLWTTKNHDARTLATLIVNPSEMSSTDLDGWIDAVNDYPLEGAVAAVVARSPHAVRKAESWRKARDEFKSAAGWNVVAALASAGSLVTNGWLAPCIDEIQERIPRAKNRTRYAMNTALIAIGGYRPALRSAALRAAKAIGFVDVDHGDTACRTPDATSYIRRMVERQRKKQAAKKRAQKKRAAKKAAKKKAAAKKAANKTVAKKKATKKKATKKKAAKKKATKKKAAKKKAAKKKATKKKAAKNKARRR